MNRPQQALECQAFEGFLATISPFNATLMNVRLFLFDLDGTLVDTSPDLALAVNMVRTARGIAPLPEKELRPYASKGAPGLLGKAMNISRSDPAFPVLRAEFLDNYAAHMTDHSRPFEGVTAMLDALRCAGVRTGVVTNKVEHLALRLTSALGLDRKLNIVLGNDSEGCAMKPAPDSLITAARLLGVHTTQILYAGDDPRDVQAAHAAGMQCAACTWGYALTPPETWDADFIAHSPADLAAWAGLAL